jgi:Major tropism determinant N-terminal domain
MAILQISQIQVRRGLNQDLPQLASGELGWSLDTRQLYIGNGTVSEGAVTEGVTEILTEYSAFSFTSGIQSNVSLLTSNVSTININIGTLESQIAALQLGQFTSNTTTLTAATSGLITTLPLTNSVINYSLIQNGTNQRTGFIRLSRQGSTVSYDEEYDETGTTDIVFSVTANATQANLNYTTTSVTNLSWQTRTI